MCISSKRGRWGGIGVPDLGEEPTYSYMSAAAAAVRWSGDVEHLGARLEHLEDYNRGDYEDEGMIVLDGRSMKETASDCLI